MERTRVRIGTRGSALALAQANMVRNALEAAGVPVDLAIITTEGDTRAVDTAWGDGAFVTAIEASLLRGDIDVAVHSAKDVPTDENPRLTIAAFLSRAPASDVVVAPAGRTLRSLADLPLGGRVGTDSPRRTAFLKAVRPDLALHPLHGNVDTRLRRLDEGQTDALVLAEAGLTRLGRADRISFRLPIDVVPPAPGQGAVAVQVRADHDDVFAAVAGLDDRSTRLAVEAERAILAASGGGCRAPLGANACVDGDRMTLTCGFARPDGSVAAIVHHEGAAGDPQLVDAALACLAASAAAAATRAGLPSVLVTRAADEASALMLALVDRGLAPQLVPAIEILPLDDGMDRAIRDLDRFDWVVVASANAARVVRAAARRTGRSLGAARPRWAAVGGATSRALEAGGAAVAIRPTRSSGTALADTLPLTGGERVLVPRSEIADEALVDRLRARGATVEPVVAYRTVEGPAKSLPSLEAALPGCPRAVVLTSGSTARGLLALADWAGACTAQQVRAIPAVCIGPATAAEAHRLGFVVVAEAAAQDVASIADAVAGFIAAPQEES